MFKNKILIPLSTEINVSLLEQLLGRSEPLHLVTMPGQVFSSVLKMFEKHLGEK